MMDGLKRLKEELGKLTGLFFILVVALDFKKFMISVAWIRHSDSHQ
jgi:hypothetical protein